MDLGARGEDGAFEAMHQGHRLGARAQQPRPQPLRHRRCPVGVLAKVLRPVRVVVAVPGCMYVERDGEMERWIDGWMDGWMDGFIWTHLGNFWFVHEKCTCR